MYEEVREWNRERGCEVRRRRYIGKLIDGEFVPNKVKVLEDELSRKELSAPTDLFSSSVQARACGATNFITGLARKLGVLDDLEATMGDNAEAVFSLALYLGIEFDRPLNRFHRWAHTHDHPWVDDITDEDLINLMRSIPAEAIDGYLRRQASRRGGTDVTVYAHSLLGSIAQATAVLREGSDAALPWLHLANFYNTATGLPVAYRICEQSMDSPDAVEEVLNDELISSRGVIWIGDGCRDVAMIDELLRRHVKFVLDVPESTLYREAVAGIGTPETEPDKWKRQESIGVYTRTKNVVRTVGARRRRVHLHFFSPLPTALREGDYSTERPKYFHTYGGGLPSKWGVRLQPDAFVFRRNPNEVHLLASSGFPRAFDAVNAFRRRDFQAALFSNLFEKMYLRPFSYGGTVPQAIRIVQVFLQFLGLIFFDATRREHSKSGLYAEMFHTELLDELDRIFRYTQPGRGARISTLTPWQEEIHHKLGVRPPGRR